MASKVQSQLDFPVRKSSRKTKSSLSSLKLNYDSDGSPAATRQVRRSNSQRATTPRRNRSKPLPEASPVRKSPSKRKPTTLASPPTPPKSPCKSVKPSASRARAPLPEIYSEESDDDEDQLSAKPSCLKPDCASALSQRLPAKTNGRLGQNTLVSQILDQAVSLRAANEIRSPNKRKCENVPPPPTPPKSPFKSSSASQNSPCKTESTALGRLPLSPTKSVLGGRQCPLQRLPTTPTKLTFRERMSSPQRQPTTPIKSPFRDLLSSPRKVTSTPTKSPCRDRLASPSRLLSSPRKVTSTPSKSPCRDRLASPSRLHRNILSPKKTPKKENQENFSLKSPRKPPPKLEIAKPDSKCYQTAKQSLHTAKPDHMVGRDQEVAEITDFLRTHLDKKSAGSLYISGAPGTGKTAAALSIIDDFKVKYKCQIAYLNCMMVKDVSSVFRRLYSELSGKAPAGRTTVKEMEKLITTSKQSMILVLDEIDHLDSKNQEVLYRIFEWPSLDNSKLILVGVANALDLTDRILPRLQAKPRCRPKLLHFAPYTRDQITAIITDRLEQSGETIVERSAVQFCARKVSAVAGDMRKALDVCRRAVELAESETRSQAVLRITDCNSPSKSQPASMKKIGVAHISKVMADVYGSSVQAQQSEGVPLQQKLLVCALLLVVKSGKFKEVQLGKLHETYCKVCKRQQMAPVDQSEFHSLCILLEARGVVGIKKAKETRLMKITLRQDEKELEQTLQDRVLVSTILKEGLPK